MKHEPVIATQNLRGRFVPTGSSVIIKKDVPCK
jgi:hypothetical protein